MAKDLLTQDSHKARQLYSEYSESMRKRKISPEFEERLKISDDERQFRIKIFGKTNLEDLLHVIEKENIKAIPGGWNKTLISVTAYATKKQILSLLKNDIVKYVKALGTIKAEEHLFF